MKTTLALLWKESRQVFWFWVGGLVLFTAMPMIPVIGSSLAAEGTYEWAYSLGWLFAIFTATGLFGPELDGRLSEFWRSRPLSARQWLLVKYLAGLLCVLVVCVGPILVVGWLKTIWPSDYEFNRHWKVVFYLSYTLTLVFSLSVLISCLVRKTTHAAILSVAAALLVYFLPLLVPALEPLSIISLMERGNPPKLELLAIENVIPGPIGIHLGEAPLGYNYGAWRWIDVRFGGSCVVHFEYFPGYWLFVGTMLSISAAAVALAMLALKRHWRIRMDQKLLFWMLGLVALLLFASGAFAVGSNLEPEQVIESEVLSKAVMKSTLVGNEGVVITGGPFRKQVMLDFPIIRFEYDDNEYKEGVFVWHKPELHFESRSIVEMVWSPEQPDTLWLLTLQAEQEEGTRHRVLRLETVYLNPETMTAETVDERVLAEHTSRDNSVPAGENLELYGEHLYAYVFGKLIVLDVHEGQVPTVVETVEDWRWTLGISAGERSVTLKTPPVPTEYLNPTEQTAFSAQVYHPMVVNESAQTAAEVSEESIRLYRFRGTEAGGIFESFAQRPATPLERLIGAFPHQSRYLGQRLYVLSDNGNTSSAALTIYQARNDGTIRRIGHFVRFDRFNNVSVLEDGRVLVVGEHKIYILEPPRR